MSVRAVFEIDDEYFEKHVKPLIRSRKNLGYFALISLEERVKRFESRQTRAEGQKAGLTDKQAKLAKRCAEINPSIGDCVVYYIKTRGLTGDELPADICDRIMADSE
jgi:hypothetical protein